MNVTKKILGLTFAVSMLVSSLSAAVAEDRGSCCNSSTVVTGPRGNTGPRGSTATNSYFLGILDPSALGGTTVPLDTPIPFADTSFTSNTSSISFDADAGTFRVIPGSYLVTISFSLTGIAALRSGTISLVGTLGDTGVVTQSEINYNQTAAATDINRYSLTFIVTPTVATTYAVELTAVNTVLAFADYGSNFEIAVVKIA